MTRVRLCTILIGFILGTPLLANDGRTTNHELESRPRSYVVVVSQATQEDARWQAVAAALVEKHGADVVTYEGNDVASCLSALQQAFPEYTCFVATPEEATRDFVANVHQLTRRLDDDPYTDTMWGILTGYNADNALRIAEHKPPLTIDRVAAGTDVELELCKEGIWYCELNKNRMVKKESGGTPREQAGPNDTTQALVNTLNQYQAQLMVTSGHATERDWQIGFRYRNGYFRCENGVLYGIDTAGQRYSVNSANPKVYLPVGNCLMGHVDSRKAMALAWMNSAGVNQMIGYTVPTWYGYGGWGLLDYFVEQPGRFTMAEAFYANHQALLHRLELVKPGLSSLGEKEAIDQVRGSQLSAAAQAAGIVPGDIRGLLFDRNVVAFYGDPAWQARMASQPCAWDQQLTEQDGRFTFTITPNRGDKSFDTVNENGSQRGGRPFFQRLPRRVKKVKLVSGKEFNPTITDDFVLIPHPGKCDSQQTYQIVFEAVE